MAKILSVSYYQALMTMRQQILEWQGHSVTSASCLQDALQVCNSDGAFDVLIIGHALPHEDKEVLIQRFRAKRPAAPVIVITNFGKQEVRGASLVIGPTAEELMGAVATLCSAKKASA